MSKKEEKEELKKWLMKLSSELEENIAAIKNERKIVKQEIEKIEEELKK